MGAQLAITSGNSYVIPSGGGVITRWRSSFDGTAALTVFRPVGADHTLIAENTQTITGVRTEFAARIPVAAGDLLGLKMTTTTPGCAYQTGDSNDIMGVAPNGPVGTTGPLSPAPGFRLNVAADVEADSDTDGFGDETQDGCTTDPSRQDDCVAPDTTLTRVPPRKTTKRRVKVAFVSDDAGARFECQLDRKAFKPCSSPKRVRVSLGNHTFKVRAVDAAGIADPAPAKAKFRVVD
jgi:hypothetical protein